MLWLGLLSRETGIPASVRLKIEDEADALSFDLAVTLRLFRFENEKELANKKWWAQALGGSDDGDDVSDAILESTELHELIRNDPYADANTIIS